MIDSETRAELTRLRDRFHDLEKQGWGTAALAKELGRGLGELRDGLHELERQHNELCEQVDGMSRAEEIGHAVTAALREDRRVRWSLSRLLASGAAALVLLVPAVHDLVTWVG